MIGEPKATRDGEEAEKTRAHRVLLGLDAAEHDTWNKGWRLREVRIKPHKSGEPGFQVILKAQDAERSYVGFHSAGSIAEALAGAVDRLARETVKWREDRPWGEEGILPTGGMTKG